VCALGYGWGLEALLWCMAAVVQGLVVSSDSGCRMLLPQTAS
jgi:hypothetical protein